VPAGAGQYPARVLLMYWYSQFYRLNPQARDPAYDPAKEYLSCI